MSKNIVPVMQEHTCGGIGGDDSDEDDECDEDGVVGEGDGDTRGDDPTI